TPSAFRGSSRCGLAPAYPWPGAPPPAGGQGRAPGRRVQRRRCGRWPRAVCSRALPLGDPFAGPRPTPRSPGEPRARRPRLRRHDRDLFIAAVRPAAALPPTCVPAEAGKLPCAIDKVSDCDLINDYPYARSLFCPAAFAAAQRMVALVAATLGAKAPSQGFFHYFQTLPDPQAPPDAQAQTTIACLDTPAPYPSGSRFV